jgi:hypothetical protein
MNPFKGNLLKDGIAIAENIEGRLTIDPAPTGGEWWSGYCMLPAGAVVNLEDICDLVLNDGRSGKVRIERINPYPHATSISFAHA